MFTQEWQLREEHETMVRHVLKEVNVMDAKNQLRAWSKRADEALTRAGHPRLDFQNCPCRLGVRR